MEQYPDEQNSMQPSAAAAANGTDEDVQTANEEYFKSFPRGFRFAPTDDELIQDYLKKQVNNEPLPPNLIREVNLYSKDPTQLIVEYNPITETEWYFFTPRDKKYPNGSRPNRSTPNGFWKPTGIDKAIPHGTPNPAGFKKTLDFYEGKHPQGKKTDWKMHEYIIKDNNNDSLNNGRAKHDMTLNDWVLCKIYKKEKNGHGDEAIATETQPPTVNVAQNNEAFSVAGENNEFEDENWNRSEKTVGVPQNNEVPLVVAGNNNIGFEDQNSGASQLTVDVFQNNEASLMTGNNKIEFEYQNSNASQPTPNQGPMHEEPGTSQSYFMVSQPIDQSEEDNYYWYHIDPEVFYGQNSAKGI